MPKITQEFIARLASPQILQARLDRGVPIPGPAGPPGPTAIQEEGVSLPARGFLNFVGSGVTAADDAANNRVTVTVSGGGATPGGPVTSIQVNDAGALAGYPALTYDGATLRLGQAAFDPTGITADRTIILPDASGVLMLSGVDQVNVRDFGAKGDGTTDDTAAIQAAIDAAFGPPGAPHGQNYNLNKILVFPPGNYKTTAPLILTQVMCVRIMGSGRGTTSIRNATSGSSVVITQGMSYSHVEGIGFGGIGPSTIFDLTWDGTGTVSLQSNSFIDCNFGPPTTKVAGSRGLRIGIGTYMGSETLILNCFFINVEYGLDIENYNALQQTVIGGDFQSCTVGVYVGYGSVNVISGTGFQGNSAWDIQQINSAGDTMFVSGCRSESTNFLNALNGISVTVASCSHVGTGTNGIFYQGESPVMITGSMSINGQVSGGNISVDSSRFNRADWVALGSIAEVTNTLYGSGPIHVDRQRFFGNPQYIGEYALSGTGGGIQQTLVEIPATVGHAIPIGKFSALSSDASPRGAVIHIDVAAAGSNYWPVAKAYKIATSHGETTGGWQTVAPVSSSLGQFGLYSPEDFELDIDVEGTGVFLRLRKTAGTNNLPYTVVNVICDAPLWVWTPSTDPESAVTPPTSYCPSAILTQHEGKLSAYGGALLVEPPPNDAGQYLDGTGHYTKPPGTVPPTSSFEVFPTDSFPAVANGNAGDYTIGYSFQVSRSLVVNGLSRVCLAGNSQDHFIGLWNKDTHALLASGTILNATASDSHNAKTVAVTNVLLVPGVNYVLGVAEYDTGDMRKGDYPLAGLASAPIIPGYSMFGVGSAEPVSQNQPGHIIGSPAFNFIEATMAGQATFDATHLTAPRTITLPDASGTMSLLPLPSASPGSGKLWYDPADSNRVKYTP